MVYLGRVRQVLHALWKLLLRRWRVPVLPSHGGDAGLGELQPQLDELFLRQKVLGVVVLNVFFEPGGNKVDPLGFWSLLGHSGKWTQQVFN